VTFLPSLKHFSALKIPLVDRLSETIVDRLNPPAEIPVLPSALVEQPPALLSYSEQLLALGTYLRQQRETLGMSVDSVSREHQIQPHLIEAIESGNANLLPEFVYVKSTIFRYAKALGINGQELVENLAAAHQRQATVNSPAPTSRILSLNLDLRIKPSYLYVGYTVFAIAAISSISTSLQSHKSTPMIDRPHPAAVSPLAR
jgi:cytoskeleton protein RodZ